MKLKRKKPVKDAVAADLEEEKEEADSAVEITEAAAVMVETAAAVAVDMEAEAAVIVVAAETAVAADAGRATKNIFFDGNLLFC